MLGLLASDMIVGHVKEQGIALADLKRLWLHQANGNMNQFRLPRKF